MRSCRCAPWPAFKPAMLASAIGVAAYESTRKTALNRETASWIQVQRLRFMIDSRVWLRVRPACTRLADRCKGSRPKDPAPARADGGKGEWCEPRPAPTEREAHSLRRPPRAYICLNRF